MTQLTNPLKLITDKELRALTLEERGAYFIALLGLDKHELKNLQNQISKENQK